MAAVNRHGVLIARTGSLVLQDDQPPRLLPLLPPPLPVCTSGLHTNFNLMEELKACKRAIAKTLPSSPHVSRRQRQRQALPTAVKQAIHLTGCAPTSISALLPAVARQDGTGRSEGRESAAVRR